MYTPPSPPQLILPQSLSPLTHTPSGPPLCSLGLRLSHTLKNRSIVSVSRLQELGHYEL